jgi:hypothetical protein
MTRALGSGVGAGYGTTTAAWGLAGEDSAGEFMLVTVPVGVV